MKKLRKAFFAVVLLAMAVSVSAQLNFGVKAGFNASTITGLKDIYNEPGIDYSNNYKPGFHIGVAAQYMFAPQMGIETGLYYSMLGSKEEYKWTEDGLDYKNTETTNPSYLQLPISFIYKFEVGQDLYLYPSLGIYLGYGIAGKYKNEIEAKGSGQGGGSAEIERNYFGKDKFSGDLNVFSDIIGDNPETESINRFDMGMTAGLNLQYSNFVFSLGYDYGFAKVNKQSIDGFDDGHNSNFKVSIGYFF